MSHAAIGAGGGDEADDEKPGVPPLVAIDDRLTRTQHRVAEHDQALTEAEQAISELANAFERCAIAFNGLNQHRLRQQWWIVGLVLVVSLQLLWMVTR
jgi:uncharacterized membrane protein YecN with MAPEG domain